MWDGLHLEDLVNDNIVDELQLYTVSVVFWPLHALLKYKAVFKYT